MADKQWPQGADPASEVLDDNTEIGSYNSTETGATKNVKFTGAQIKAYTNGTLSADIAQNASDIVDNTNAIGVNSGLINDNTVEISSNESRISANESGISDNVDDIDALEANIDQGVKTTDTPTFDGVISGASSLKWKTFTGTTDSSGDVTVAHGITGTIIGISGGIFVAGASGQWFSIGYFNDAASPTGWIYAGYNGSNINLFSRAVGGGATFENANYNLVVFYV